MSTSQQNRKYLTEAFALKFESVKYEMELKEPNSTRDSNVLIEILALLQRKQDRECQKILDVGTLVSQKVTLKIIVNTGASHSGSILISLDSNFCPLL